MWDTQISALGGWPTVSGRFVRQGGRTKNPLDTPVMTHFTWRERARGGAGKLSACTLAMRRMTGGCGTNGFGTASGIETYANHFSSHFRRHMPLIWVTKTKKAIDHKTPLFLAHLSFPQRRKRVHVNGAASLRKATSGVVRGPPEARGAALPASGGMAPRL
jgi:hypothetical protein